MRRCANLAAQCYTTAIICYIIHTSTEVLKEAIKYHVTPEIFNTDCERPVYMQSIYSV